MRLRRYSVGVFTAIAATSAVLAGATIWLLLTSPITVANAVNSVNEGDVTPFVRELAEVLWKALGGLLKYL